MKDLKNKNLVLAAIAREMNFWYDVSLKTDSNITKEEAENKIIGLHEAYFDIKGNKGHASLVAGIDEEAGDVDSMYQLVLKWMVNKRIYTSYNKTRQILSYHMIYDIIFAK